MDWLRSLHQGDLPQSSNIYQILPVSIKTTNMYNIEDEENDDSYWDEPNPKEYRSEDILSSGSSGSFRCPECGSYNTMQGVYFDLCKTCNWSQGY